MSGFVTNEGKQEYINSYHEAMSYLPQPVESKMLNTDFGKVKLYKFQEEETPDKTPLAGQSTMHHSEKSFQIGLENLRNPYSNMVLFEDASHAINGEYPEKLLQTIEDFLKHIE
jgi:hypothetical protein